MDCWSCRSSRSPPLYSAADPNQPSILEQALDHGRDQLDPAPVLLAARDAADRRATSEPSLPAWSATDVMSTNAMPRSVAISRIASLNAAISARCCGGVAEVGAARSARVIGRRHDDHSLARHNGQHRSEDLLHVGAVAVDRDAADDVVHPDQDRHKSGLQISERGQLVPDQVTARVAVDAQVRDELERNAPTQRRDELVRAICPRRRRSSRSCTSRPGPRIGLTPRSASRQEWDSIRLHPRNQEARTRSAPPRRPRTASSAAMPNLILDSTEFTTHIRYRQVSRIGRSPCCTSLIAPSI